MIIINDIDELNSYLKITNKNSLGFVPTMGALHQGHISLIEQSTQENKHTIVSIYVNPTQFDQVEDLEKYPDVLEKDIIKLQKANVDALFIPDYKDIYPDDFSYKINESRLSNDYCGAHRNGHFDGVLTVVMKLLNLINPHKAYFGEKDYQQFILIKNMVNAFFMKTEIIGCPIIRESDGLAMSSRNLRLTSKQRVLAPQIYQTISSGCSIKQMELKLKEFGFDVEYIQLLDNRLLIAAKLGNIRLIDNVETLLTQETQL